MSKFIPLLVLLIIAGVFIGGLVYRDNCIDNGNTFKIGKIIPKCEVK